MISRGDSINYNKAKGRAAGQYLGYALQPVRFFYHLLKCDPDASVGLEHVDDISVHSSLGVILAEQCKSALTTNPVSDWSIDLWKTFSNWVENTESGYFNPDITKYHLYVTPVKKGKIVQKLSDAKDESEIAVIIKDIEARLTRLSSVPGCHDHLQIVLRADRGMVTKIIKNFSFAYLIFIHPYAKVLLYHLAIIHYKYLWPKRIFCSENK